MERAEAADGAAWLQWRKFARKEHKGERQRRRAVDEDGEEREVGSQIAQKVVAFLKEKVSEHNGDKEAVERPAGQSVMRCWDCSQIENEEEEDSWRERDQMAAQWDEEQQLTEIWERRRMEGSSLKVEVLQKAPELVVHERMSQGKGVKGLKEKKKVPGWSFEEMKEIPNIAVVDDTEEMRKWGGFSQSEMDLCWKKLAERMEEEVLGKYKVEESKREAFRGTGAPLKWRRVRKDKKYRIRK